MHLKVQLRHLALHIAGIALPPAVGEVLLGEYESLDSLKPGVAAPDQGRLQGDVYRQAKEAESPSTQCIKYQVSSRGPGGSQVAR